MRNNFPYWMNSSSDGTNKYEGGKEYQKYKVRQHENLVQKTEDQLRRQAEIDRKAVDRRVQSFSDLVNSKQTDLGARPEYKVHVISEIEDVNGRPIRVSAYLPETIDLDFGSDYRTPFYDNPLPGKVGDIIKAFGNTGIVQEMTYKVWDGSRGITLTLPLVFVADDEYSGGSDREDFDINEPILKLLKLCAPSKKAGTSFLNPPGPTLDFNDPDDVINAWQRNESTTDDGSNDLSDAPWYAKLSNAIGEKISAAVSFNKITSVYIGNAITLPNVVIESVSQNYDTMFDSSGKFIRGKVNLTLSTVLTPTIEDLNSFYGRSDMNIKSNSGRS